MKIEAGVYWAPGQAPVRGRTNIFVLDWSDHPAKTSEWFERTKAQSVAEGMQHIFAQEVERNRSASVEGTIIPGNWVGPDWARSEAASRRAYAQFRRSKAPRGPNR
jgi:phage terminase large subunit